MDISTYREQMAQQTIFEAQGNGMVSNQILETGPGKLSPDGAMYNHVLLGLSEIVNPIVGEMLKSICNNNIGLRPLIDGWATEQAVKAEAKAQGINQSEPEKKKGIRGLL